LHSDSKCLRATALIIYRSDVFGLQDSWR